LTVPSFAQGTDHGFDDLAREPVPSWIGFDGFDVRLCLRLRARLKGAVMLLILLTVVVSIFLFVYLLAALLRPEWF
jgi:K+-transporting ATPase KdpF subunit